MARKRRGAAMLALSAFLAPLAITAVDSPAQASVFAHEIKNPFSGKCLDVATENNTNVQLWRCSGGTEQKWNVAAQSNGADWFQNQRASSKCLTSTSISFGIHLVVQDCAPFQGSDWKVIFS